ARRPSGREPGRNRAPDPSHDPRRLPRRRSRPRADRRAAAGPRLGPAPNADSGALPDRWDHPPRRLDHRRPRPQRGGRHPGRPRDQHRGGRRGRAAGDPRRRDGRKALMEDAQVHAAIEHWASRLIQNGVDYNDFVRTTARIDRWERWLAEWTRTADEHEEYALESERAGRGRTAGEAWLRAAVCRHFGKFVWMVDPALAAEATRRSVAEMRRAHQHLDPTAERVEAPCDGARVFANLRRPRSARRPPLVVLIPGLDSTKEEFFFFEAAYLARGMATLSIDGPGQGEAGL